MLKRALALLAVGAAIAVSTVTPGHADFNGCIEGTVVLDSLTVPAGTTYCLSPASDVTLEIANGGNLIVYGTLRAKPANAGVHHTIRFTGVNEAGYVGAGNEPIASDPGLWVQGDGVLDIAGTPVVPWNRTGDDVTWSSTDELVSTPITAGSYSTFPSFTKGAAVPYTTAPDGAVYTAEVLNLTRNVNIEGVPGHRAHVHIKSSAPQTIKNAVIRYMGPRKDLNGDGYSDPIPGRSSLHFHRTGEGSRGSLIENVVVRDGGGERGYDIHASHGVTVRGSISYVTNGDGIGWVHDEQSNDTLIEGFVAAKQVPVPAHQGYVLAGIDLSGGSGNTVRDSVAVGNLGNKTASGVQWPEMVSTVPNVWTAQDVVSHNNKTNGVYTWQNSTGDHVVNNFVCYLNGRAGIEHGAYLNHYVYNNPTSWGNGVAGFIAHANSNTGASGQTLQILGGKIDGVLVPKHTLAGSGPVEFRDLNLARVGGYKMVINETTDAPGAFDFYSSGIEPTDVLVTRMAPGSVYRVKRADGTAFKINADGSTTPIVF